MTEDLFFLIIISTFHQKKEHQSVIVPTSSISTKFGVILFSNPGLFGSRVQVAGNCEAENLSGSPYRDRDHAGAATRVAE